MRQLNVNNTASGLLINWLMISIVLIGATGAAQANVNCLISVATYKKMAKHQAFTIIDTRSKEDYQQYWIEASLNFPKQQIKTKVFLKNKSLLLIGKGKFNDHLVMLCEELKKDGYWEEGDELELAFGDDYLEIDGKKIKGKEFEKYLKIKERYFPNDEGKFRYRMN